jgi:hypothetical protein
MNATVHSPLLINGYSDLVQFIGDCVTAGNVIRSADTVKYEGFFALHPQITWRPITDDPNPQTMDLENGSS